MSFELIDDKTDKVHYAPKPGRISYPQSGAEAIPRNPLSEAQNSQHFLDLSCFAEKWWQEQEGLEAGGGSPADPVTAPWRPIWPARQVRVNKASLNPDWHSAGENQACLVCDLPLDEPFTLCDTCGEALSRLYLQRYGVDLQHPHDGEHAEDVE